MPLSSKEKLDIIKGSLTGAVDKPAFLAIQEAEELMAEEEAIARQQAEANQATQEQPIEQPEVASTGGTVPAGPQVPHPSSGASQPHLVNSASSMEIGLNQASGTSRGATTLGTDGTYREGGPKKDKTMEVSMNAPLYDSHGRCFANCQQREFDSLHNFYLGSGLSMGKKGEDFTMAGRLNAGYEFHPRGGTGNITGHIGGHYGTRMVASDANDGSLDPFANITGSLGYEGEVGGNSYQWQNATKWGLGAYAKKDVLGNTGTTIGGYGHFGQLNATLGYNPNTGTEATIGVGIPFRRTGGFQYDVPTIKKSMSMDELLRRQRFQESSFRHGAVNKDSGATGVAQIMPDTLDYAKMKGWVPKSTTMKDLKNYDVSEKIQVNYMNNLIDRDWNKGSDKVKRAKALIAYNWGPENTRKRLNKLKKEGIDIYSDDLSWLSYFNEESRDYVDRILLNEGDFEEQYNQGLKDNIPLKMRMGGCSKSKMLYNKVKRKK